MGKTESREENIHLKSIANYRLNPFIAHPALPISPDAFRRTTIPFIFYTKYKWNQYLVNCEKGESCEKDY